MSYERHLSSLLSCKSKRMKPPEQLEKSRKKQPARAQRAVQRVSQWAEAIRQALSKKYSGARTIAPLDSYTVKQKFGNYVDPIYNIKIFNEAVILRSTTPDAKVKSVLNGKVVFAKATPMLENVVIIENENGIHTIYAHLSQIAPTVKVGSLVQKGYVIGRVRNDLTFEVTQRNYHIDPLEMISK